MVIKFYNSFVAHKYFEPKLFFRSCLLLNKEEYSLIFLEFFFLDT